MPNIRYFKESQILLACGLYAALLLWIWLLSLLPSLYWLRVRAGYLMVVMKRDEWKGAAEATKFLQELDQKIQRWAIWVSTSQVQAGWRLIHSIEADHARDLSDKKLKPN